MNEAFAALAEAQGKGCRHAESAAMYAVYQQQGARRYRSNGNAKKPVATLFFEKIAMGFSDCWYWIASRDKTGYGRVSRNTGAGESFAHRWSWILHNGPIPDGMKILHKCDVPSCVNPDHLFLGTQADNVRDMCEKGRARSGARPGSGSPNHKLTYEQAASIRAAYDAGGVTQYQLADQFGVAVMTINRIVNRKSWVE